MAKKKAKKKVTAKKTAKKSAKKANKKASIKKASKKKATSKRASTKASSGAKKKVTKKKVAKVKPVKKATAKKTATKKASKKKTSAKKATKAPKPVSAVGHGAQSETPEAVILAPSQPIEFSVVVAGSREELVRRVNDMLYVQWDGTVWVPEGGAFIADGQWHQTLARFE